MKLPVNFKKLNDVLDDQVVKNTKFNTLKTKINKKTPDAIILIYINQCNTGKQNLEKKIGDADKKIPDVSGLVTATVLKKKLKKLIAKYITLAVQLRKRCNAKMIEIEGKYFTTSDYNKFMSDILDAEIKYKEIVNRSDISNLVENSD